MPTHFAVAGEPSSSVVQLELATMLQSCAAICCRASTLHHHEYHAAWYDSAHRNPCRYNIKHLGMAASCAAPPSPARSRARSQVARQIDARQRPLHRCGPRPLHHASLSGRGATASSRGSPARRSHATTGQFMCLSRVGHLPLTEVRDTMMSRLLDEVSADRRREATLQLHRPPRRYAASICFAFRARIVR